MAEQHLQKTKAVDQDVLVAELEVRVDRLRSLYDQYFMGIEKLQPSVVLKDVERRFQVLRKQQIRNTALRFRFQVVVQKFSTYQAHWMRICRQIEEGTYKRDLRRAKERFGDTKRAKGKEIEVEVDMDDFESTELDMNDLMEDDAPAPVILRRPSLAAPDSLAPPSFESGAPAFDFSNLDDPGLAPKAPRSSGSLNSLDDPGDGMAIHARAPVEERARPEPQSAPKKGGVLRKIGWQPTQSVAPGAPGTGKGLVRPGGGPLNTPQAFAPVAAPNASAPAMPAPTPPQNMQARGKSSRPPGKNVGKRRSSPPAEAAPSHAAPAQVAPPAAKPVAAAPARRPSKPPAAQRPAPAPAPVRPPPRVKAEGELSDERVRQLYTQYIEAKRSRQESTASLTYDSLAQSLRDSTAKLRQKHNGKNVDFEVTVKDGKTILRPVVK